MEFDHPLFTLGYFNLHFPSVVLTTLVVLLWVLCRLSYNKVVVVHPRYLEDAIFLCSSLVLFPFLCDNGNHRSLLLWIWGNEIWWVLVLLGYTIRIIRVYNIFCCYVCNGFFGWCRYCHNSCNIIDET